MRQTKSAAVEKAKPRGRHKALASLPDWAALLEDVRAMRGSAPIVRFASVVWPTGTAEALRARAWVAQRQELARVGAAGLGDLADAPFADLLPPPLRSAWSSPRAFVRTLTDSPAGVCAALLWGLRTCAGTAAEGVVTCLAHAGRLLAGMGDAPAPYKQHPALYWCMNVLTQARHGSTRALYAWTEDTTEPLGTVPTDRPWCLVVEDVLDATAKAIRCPWSVVQSAGGRRPRYGERPEDRLLDAVVRLTREGKYELATKVYGRVLREIPPTKKSQLRAVLSDARRAARDMRVEFGDFRRDGDLYFGRDPARSRATT